VRRLAESGYVGYAIDMGGAGAVATHIEHAATMTAQAAIPLQRKVAKFGAAMAALKRDPHVDPARISAIGTFTVDVGGRLRLRRHRPLVQDHPVDAEPVLHLTEPRREERLLHRHQDATAAGKS
jgi:hypothetical protein